MSDLDVGSLDFSFSFFSDLSVNHSTTPKTPTPFIPASRRKEKKKSSHRTARTPIRHPYPYIVASTYRAPYNSTGY